MKRTIPNRKGDITEIILNALRESFYDQEVQVIETQPDHLLIRVPQNDMSFLVHVSREV